MRILGIYKRPEFLTLCTKSMFWKVNAHTVYFFALFIMYFCEKYAKFNFCIVTNWCAASCAENPSDEWLFYLFCNIGAFFWFNFCYWLWLQHVDHYSRTKAIAEMKILSANNSAAGDKVLRTCAIRLAGVYGPGEQRHLPRIVVSCVVPSFFMAF